MTFQEPSPSGTAGTINAAGNLLKLLLDRYGPNKTLALVVGGILLASLWRYYSERRKDRKADAALEEKERSIRRLAREARFYKAALFKEKLGWTDEQIKMFLMDNEVDDTESNSAKPKGLWARIKALLGV